MVSCPAGGSGKPQSTLCQHTGFGFLLHPSDRFISAVSPLCSRLTALSKFLFSLTTGRFFEVSRQSYCISRIQEWLLDSRICSLSRAWPMNHIWFTACVCK